MPVHKKVNKDFFRKWTLEMAYVLGFFAADGYITINKRGGHFWCIQINDRKLLEKIRKTIGSNHKISERTYLLGVRKNSYRLQIGSKEMCTDLRTLGYDVRKTNHLLVPTMPSNFFASFVRGYFDGDGNVWVGYIHKERKSKTFAIRTVFTSCSENFLKKLKSNLESSGIERGVISKGKGNYYRLTYSIHSSLKLYDFMYNHTVLGNLYLERKKKIFDKYIKMRP